jgi:hypothetical protein
VSDFIEQPAGLGDTGPGGELRMPEKTSGRSRKGPAKAAASPGAPAGVDQYIVGQLKAIYDEVAAEPIPDRLRQLLDRLDRRGKS